MPRPRLPRSLLAHVVLAMAAGLYLFPFVRCVTEGIDAGIFLSGAAMVARGAIPGRDFVEPSGPGGFLWLGLFFRLFGTTLLTAAVLLNTTAIATTLLAFHLSRRLGGKGLFAALFILVTLVPLVPNNSPHYDSILFLLIAFSVFLMAWERLIVDGNAKPYAPLATCGVLLGVASWFIQQEGLYLVAALTASVLWVMRRKGLLCASVMVGSYAFVLALQFYSFALLHSLPDLLYANYIRPLTSYGNVNAAPYGFPIWDNLWPSFLSASEGQAVAPVAWIKASTELVPFLTLMWLPLLLPLAAYVGKVNVLQARTVPYWLAAYALWSSEIYRMDIGHLRYGSVLLAILFFTICERSSHRILNITGLVLIGCLAFCAAANFQGSLQSQIPLESRRGVSYAQKPLPLIGFLETHTLPGEDVFIYPYQPIYYFLCDLHNPTRYFVLMYHYNSDSEFVEATNDLERKKVRYVVYDDLFSGQNLAKVFPAYRHPDSTRLIMEPYLVTHYRQVQTVGRFRILERLN